MKTDSIVTPRPRNWHDVKENRGQLVLHVTLFFIILHNNLLLNENEFAIRDQILLNNCSEMVHDSIFFPVCLVTSVTAL